MQIDIVDLTDSFNEIICNYEGGMADGCVVDFDAWDLDDIAQLTTILDRVLELRVQDELAIQEREVNDSLLEEYENVVYIRSDN